MTVRLLAAVCLVVALATMGGAAMNRFSLAGQDDWGAKRGFYLNFENDSEGDTPCRLETLRLFLGVGDGRQWRFVRADGPWQAGEHRVRAVITPRTAKLWVDDKLVGESAGRYRPQPGPVRAGYTIYWANGPADYAIVQSAVRVQAGSREQSLTLHSPDDPLPVILMSPYSPRSIDLQPKAGETVTVEAALRLLPRPDTRAFAPLVDRYGQLTCTDWPGKIKADADLAAAAAEEERRLLAMGAPGGLDRYGGCTTAWREEPTGFFRVAQRNGYWWLVTPDGHPCFFTGLCTAPAATWDQTPVTGREFLFESLPADAPGWGEDPWGQDPGIRYFAPHSRNMLAKYGPGWQAKTDELMARRLRAWAFTGIGKWGGMADTPSLPVLSRAGVPVLVKHPDVFDDQVRAALRETLRKQVQPRRADPFVVGWSLGNEVEEIIFADEVAQVMAGPDTPCKRALLEHGRATIYHGDAAKLATAWGQAGKPWDDLPAAALKLPPADLEVVRRHWVDQYYGFAYRTVKELDPNHLYLGNWMIPGAWQNEQDWRIVARHCDVFGYDRYAQDDFADAWFARLLAETGKPALCGEFSYPAWYGGRRGFGMYGVWVEDDAASGEAYRRWVEAASRNPYCLGGAWFQYRDEPITGRGPGHGADLVYGENYAFGFVDVADRPKWGLVEPARRANLQAVHTRLAATAAPARR